MLNFIKYFIVFQALCGVSSAALARNKGYSGLRWLLKGAFLPIVGVVLAWRLKPKRWKRDGRKTAATRRKRPPKRCCGRYIPDCAGCPFFQKPLFDEPAVQEKKGRCLRYGRDLIVEAKDKRNRVIMEEEKEEEEA